MVEDSRRLTLKLQPIFFLEFPGDLVTMQILIQQAGVGPKNLRF